MKADATMTRAGRLLRQEVADQFSHEQWRSLIRDTWPSSLSRVGPRWIERYGAQVDWTAVLLPDGLCGNRDEHPAHLHESASPGVFWCTADQARREPGRSERRRSEQAKDRNDMPQDRRRTDMTPAEMIAGIFHATYETLAPDYGYKTRDASAVSWDDVPEPNRSLMIATVQNMLDLGAITPGPLGRPKHTDAC